MLREVYTNISNKGPEGGEVRTSEGQHRSEQDVKAQPSEGHTNSRTSTLRDGGSSLLTSAANHGGGGSSSGNGRKRKRKREEEASYFEWTEELMQNAVPAGMESRFVAAIFELGLKHSSPKVLMQLMPDVSTLTTEHIKSHLQKYRMHCARSKQEFVEFYDLRLRESFAQFCTSCAWRSVPPTLPEDECDDEDADEQLAGLLEPKSINAIHELSGQVIREQMQLQQVLQEHIMAQVKLQQQLLEQLDTPAVNKRDVQSSGERGI